MKRTLPALIGLVGLVLIGCVPSWNPFYTEKDLVFEPGLLGRWRPADAKETSPEIWAFSRGGEKRYQLDQTDDEGHKAVFEAHLLRLKGQAFLDLYLTKLDAPEAKVNAWASFSMVPAHLLLKVDQVEPVLKLAAMNPDWMQKFLKAHPEALAHRVVADGNIVLAAGTGELQRFVLEHLADKEFFGESQEMKRR